MLLMSHQEITAKTFVNKLFFLMLYSKSLTLLGPVRAPSFTENRLVVSRGCEQEEMGKGSVGIVSIISLNVKSPFELNTVVFIL